MEGPRKEARVNQKYILQSALTHFRQIFAIFSSETCLNSKKCPRGVLLVWAVMKVNFFFFADLNECLTETAACPPNSSCANTDGSYECHCDGGFQAVSPNTCEGLLYSILVPIYLSGQLPGLTSLTLIINVRRYSTCYYPCFDVVDNIHLSKILKTHVEITSNMDR